MVSAESLLASAANQRDLPPDGVTFGGTRRMTELREKLDKVAAANVPVLVRGESGTGKEIIAQLIHRKSPWRQGPFVKVSCPAIPGTLLESELFGYTKGAFTGAYGTKPGRVELANRGTLFLDEIGELDGGLQAKLLQLLQDGQFCPIGGQEDKRSAHGLRYEQGFGTGDRERCFSPRPLLPHQCREHRATDLAGTVC